MTSFLSLQYLANAKYVSTVRRNTIESGKNAKLYVVLDICNAISEQLCNYHCLVFDVHDLFPVQIVRTDFHKSVCLLPMPHPVN